jgi:anaerobic selenocysteine-containing dehydrogenase
VREAVEMLRESDAPVILAGGSQDAIVASHYINLKFGNVGKTGGMLAPQLERAAASGSDLREVLSKAQVILIEGANPAYMLPPSSGVLDALKRADAVISFAGFVDDTAAWSDLVLPAHHPLESEIAVVPIVSPRPALNASAPFVRPLYDTRPFEKILADLTKGPVVTVKDVVASDGNIDDVLRQGGLWLEAKPEAATKPAAVAFPVAAAPFDGDASQFPLLFQPYLSVQYGDGSGANLPWLQELPDPASSSIWGLPVEIDPKTAAALRIANGDMVRVESPHGSLEAAAYVHPGAVPGVVSMAAGDGHSFYTRYASGRGANPFSILGAEGGRTRVKLARVGPRQNWIQFSAPDREEREHSHR